jgi:hypothetical protein
MWELLLVVEVTIMTGIMAGAAATGLLILKRIRGTIGPIVGLINNFGR